MQTFYRIEHKETGAGMYHQGNFGTPNFYDILRDTDGDSYDDRHPSPYFDSKLRTAFEERNVELEDLVFVGSKYSYGFCSLEQLRGWLYNDAWLVKLNDAGFVLAVAESDDFYEGNTQALFVKPATYQTVSIKDYFNL